MNQSEPPAPAAEPERDPDTPRAMLSTVEVMKLLSMGRTTIFRLERNGKFPKSRYLTKRRRLYYADEIAKWQRDLPDTNHLAERIPRKRR